MSVLRGEKRLRPLRSLLRTQTTTPEKILWQYLCARHLLGMKFRRQHGVGPYIVDFYCAEQKLVIEIDGETHGAVHQQMYDNERTLYLQTLGLRVVRYSNKQIMCEREGVLVDLQRHLKTGPTSPTPPYKGGA